MSELLLILLQTKKNNNNNAFLCTTFTMKYFTEH